MPRSAATRHNTHCIRRKGIIAVKHTDNYEDILHLPHHVSPTRAKMSMIERAAQFAPFAALTGYDAAIQETARLTGQRVELDESEKAALDQKLQQLLSLLPIRPSVKICHFVEDSRKEGGEYITTLGCLQKIDFYSRSLLVDGILISIDDCLSLQCEELEE